MKEDTQELVKNCLTSCNGTKRKYEDKLYIQMNKFIRVLFSTKPIFYNYRMKFYNSHEDFEDMIQEAILNVLNNLHYYDERKSRFRTWAEFVLLGGITKYWRREKKQLRNRPLETISFDDRKKMVYGVPLSAIMDSCLTDIEKKIIKYHFYDGLIVRQITKLTGYGHMTLAVLKRQALKKMKDEICPQEI